MLKLKIEIRKDKEESNKMNCAIQCAGSVADVITETAEVVKKIKKSLAENGPAVEAAFVTAISAAIMDMSFNDLAKEVMEEFKKKE